MTSFELTMLQRMQKFLATQVEEYHNDLTRELPLLKQYPHASAVVDARIILVEQQIQVVSDMLVAPSFDVFIPLVQQYLYLKKQI